MDRVEEKPSLSIIKPRSKKRLVGSECECFEDTLSNYYVESFRATAVLSGVFFIDNVITEAECKALCTLVRDSPELSFWCQGKEEDSATKAFRNVQTIEVNSQKLADMIWTRIVSIFESHTELSQWSIDSSSPHSERELEGNWKPSGLNPDMLFANYPPFGSFAPHTDGRAIMDFNHRSLYSVIIFLNSIPLNQGGGTRFYHQDAVQKLKLRVSGDTEVWSADEDLVLGTVEAVAGRFLFFDQSIVHEGVPPIYPYEKMIIRSDVIYERTPPVCDSAVDREAYQIYRQGEDLVECGEVNEGILLFRKALKMSPALATAMGQG